jgi:hypothetical protein
MMPRLINIVPASSETMNSGPEDAFGAGVAGSMGAMAGGTLAVFGRAWGAVTDRCALDSAFGLTGPSPARRRSCLVLVARIGYN